ncbi:MAG: hypothetical protein FWD59_08140 [Micrococcales bacterium]|nr:hypothetical protein [Micrococcales bacterium]
MVSETLWRQVEVLSFEDKLSLIQRVEDSFGSVPEDVLPHLTAEELVAETDRCGAE